MTRAPEEKLYTDMGEEANMDNDLGVKRYGMRNAMIYEFV
jgi:hypothetical protein